MCKNSIIFNNYYFLVEGFHSKDQDQLEISEDIAEKLEGLNPKKGKFL